MIGVTNLQDLTAPASGAVQMSESERVLNVDEEALANGNSTPIPDKHVTRNVMIRGIGDAELSSLAAGAGTHAKAAVAVIERKQSESTTGAPKFEIKGIAIEDVAVLP